MEIYNCKWSELPENLVSKTRLLKNGLYPEGEPVAQLIDKKYNHRYNLYDLNQAKPINQKSMNNLSINFDMHDKKSEDYAILNLTTTGVMENDEIIEICLLDMNGTFLFSKRFKPLKDIHPKAFLQHHLASYMLSDANIWTEKWDELKALLEAKILLINNSQFQLKMLKQTCQKYKVDFDFPINIFDVNVNKSALIEMSKIPTNGFFDTSKISGSPISEAMKILSLINGKALVFDQKVLAKNYFKQFCEKLIKSGNSNGFARGQQWLEMNFGTMDFNQYDLTICTKIAEALEPLL